MRDGLTALLAFISLVHAPPLRRLACQPIPGNRTAAFIGLLKSGEPSIGSALTGLTLLESNFLGSNFLASNFSRIRLSLASSAVVYVDYCPAADVLHYHVRHASVVCRRIVSNAQSAD